VQHELSLPHASVAPLPQPVVDHLVAARLSSYTALHAVQMYPSVVDHLRGEVRVLRAHVFRALAPLVAANALTSQALLRLVQAVSPQKSHPEISLLTTWRQRGLLRMQRRNYPDPQSAAALLLARKLSPAALRRWLPSALLPTEPFWYCYRQDAPQSPLAACPVPLPPAIPQTTLLWTPWVGASWLPDWQLIDTVAVYASMSTMAELDHMLDHWRLPRDQVQATLENTAGPDDERLVIQRVWCAAILPYIASLL